MPGALSDVKSHRLFLVALAGIVSLALGLRLWGIRFGLPYAYHVDEQTYVSTALNLGAGIIGRHPNPTGFSNVLFGEFVGYLVVGRISGIFASLADFERGVSAGSQHVLASQSDKQCGPGRYDRLVVYRLGKASAGRRTGGWRARLWQ